MSALSRYYCPEAKSEVKLITLYHADLPANESRQAFRVLDNTTVFDLINHLKKIYSNQEIQLLIQQNQLFTGSLNTCLFPILQQQNIRTIQFKVIGAPQIQNYQIEQQNQSQLSNQQNKMMIPEISLPSYSQANSQQILKLKEYNSLLKNNKNLELQKQITSIKQQFDEYLIQQQQKQEQKLQQSQREYSEKFQIVNLIINSCFRIKKCCEMLKLKSILHNQHLQLQIFQKQKHNKQLYLISKMNNQNSLTETKPPERFPTQFAVQDQMFNSYKEIEKVDIMQILDILKQKTWNLNQELFLIKEEKKELENKINDENKEKNQQIVQIQKMNEEINILQENIIQLNQQIDDPKQDLEQRNKELTLQIISLQQQNSVIPWLQQQMKQLQDENKNLNDEGNQQKIINKQQLVQIQEVKFLQDENQKLMDQLIKLKEFNNKEQVIQNINQVYEQQLSQLISQNSVLSKQITEAQQQINRLQIKDQEYIKLQNDLQYEKQKYSDLQKSQEQQYQSLINTINSQQKEIISYQHQERGNEQEYIQEQRNITKILKQRQQCQHSSDSVVEQILYSCEQRIIQCKICQKPITLTISKKIKTVGESYIDLQCKQDLGRILEVYKKNIQFFHCNNKNCGFFCINTTFLKINKSFCPLCRQNTIIIPQNSQTELDEYFPTFQKSSQQGKNKQIKNEILFFNKKGY